MRKFIALFFLLPISIVLVSACGGGSAPAPTATPAPAATSSGVSVGSTAVAPTATTAPALGSPTTAGATAAPTRTPDNTVATADPNAANTSFQTAKALGKDPIKFSIKESTFYYKVDVARGGIISATLSVDAGSPAPARLQIYDELQNYINQTDVPVGRSGQLKYMFNQKGGGTTYIVVQGNSNVTLSAQALAQNDGNSKGDAGDDFDTATVIQPGTLTGMLGDADGEDYYVIDLPKTGGVFNTTIKTADGAVKAQVYDDGRNYIGETASDKNKSQAGTYQTVLSQNQGGRWFVYVPGSGTYTLTTSFGAQNDAGSGKDAGDDFDTATPIRPGSYTGLLGGADHEDYYAVDLSKAGGVLSVTVKTTDGSVKIDVYSDKRDYIGEAGSDKSQPQGGTYRVVLPLNQGGQWFIYVTGDGSYSFTYGYTQQNDGGSNKDAGDSKDTAVAISKATIDGIIGPNDDNDTYKVQAALGRKLAIRYGASNVNLNVSIYDNNMNILNDVSIEGGKTANLADDTGASGDYYIVVEHGDGDYHITINK